MLEPCSRGARALRNCQQSQDLSIYVNPMPFFTIGSYFPLPEALYAFQNQLDPCNTVKWKVHTFKCNPLLGRKLQHMTKQIRWVSMQHLPIASISDYFEAWFSLGSTFSHLSFNCSQCFLISYKLSFLPSLPLFLALKQCFLTMKGDSDYHLVCVSVWLQWEIKGWIHLAGKVIKASVLRTVLVLSWPEECMCMLMPRHGGVHRDCEVRSGVQVVAWFPAMVTALTHQLIWTSM